MSREGHRQAPVGIRDLHLSDGKLHALVGNLDSDPDESILLAEYPEAGVAQSTHLVATYPGGTKTLLRQCEARVQHCFDGLYRVEGLTDDAGRFLYVSDEDNIVRTRFFSSGDTSIVAN